MIRYRNKSLIYSFYCAKCNRKRTNLAKFGCENPFQSSKIKNKIKETTLKRYGVDNVNKLPSIRQKISEHRDEDAINKKVKKTLMEHYGVDNPQKDNAIREKTSKICWNKYGKAFYNREKFEHTMLTKYGVKHALQIKDMCSHSHHKYKFDNNIFDSSWEMAKLYLVTRP